MRSIAWLHKTLAVILLGLIALSLPASTGCGINSNLTADQQDKDAAVRMAWVEKAIQVAERHGLAYRVEVNASGRPSIGELSNKPAKFVAASSTEMFVTSITISAKARYMGSRSDRTIGTSSSIV